MPLSEDVLIQILTEPKNALVRQYQYFFSMENAELEFTPAALSKLAHKAMSRDTGARALRSVMEDIMLDLMYELPELTNDGAKYVHGCGTPSRPASNWPICAPRKKNRPENCSPGQFGRYFVQEHDG